VRADLQVGAWCARIGALSLARRVGVVAFERVGCQNSAMVPDERFQSGSASELNFRWTPQVHLAQTRCSGGGHPGW